MTNADNYSIMAIMMRKEMKMTFGQLRVARTLSPLSVEVLEIQGDSAKVRCLTHHKVFWTDKNNLENIRKMA